MNILKLLFLSIIISISANIPLQARTFIIHCEVFDIDNGPVIGATVRVLNTVLGAKVNREGQCFVKNVPPGVHELLVTAVGYEKQKMLVSTDSAKTHDSHINVVVKMKSAPVETEEIVVSGTRTEKIYQDVPVKISVVDTKLFESTSSSDLREGLCFQPGVRVENNCQNCSFTQVRLNGLEGQYSQILIDSRPVFSTLNGVYGLEQLPTNMIERVEIIRGGGSALFGGSAIAGVINIITKDPVSNEFSAGITQSYTDGVMPDFNGHMNASVVNDAQNLGLAIFGMTRSRRQWDANGDGFTEVPRLKLNSFGARGFYKIDSKTKMNAEFHTLFDERRGGDMFDVEPHHANICESASHKTNSGGVSIDHYFGQASNQISAYVSFQVTNRESFYGAKEVMNSDEIVDAYGTSDNKTYVGGLKYTHPMDGLAGAHVFTAGYEVNYDDIIDRAPSYNRIIDQFTRTHGFYLQDDWALTDEFSILLGVRGDKHNMIKDLIISPRANVLYKITEKLSLRGSFSTGYRAPQTFDEDLHITQVGGEAKIHLNSPDLKPEYSTSLGAAVDYSFDMFGLPTAISLDLFRTHLKDVFYTTVISDENSQLIVEERRNNEDGANVSGLTFELQTAKKNTFDFRAGFTYEQAKYDNPVEWNENDIESGDGTTDKLLRTPDWYGYFNLSWKLTQKAAIDVSSVLTGPMLAPHLAGGIRPDGSEVMFDELVETDTFFELNGKFSYEVSSESKIKLFIGMYNILNSFQEDFDTGLGRDAGYVYGPGRPRTPYIGISAGM